MRHSGALPQVQATSRPHAHERSQQEVYGPHGRQTSGSRNLNASGSCQDRLVHANEPPSFGFVASRIQTELRDLLTYLTVLPLPLRQAFQIKEHRSDFFRAPLLNWNAVRVIQQLLKASRTLRVPRLGSANSAEYMSGAIQRGLRGSRLGGKRPAGHGPSQLLPCVQPFQRQCRPWSLARSVMARYTATSPFADMIPSLDGAPLV